MKRRAASELVDQRSGRFAALLTANGWFASLPDDVRSAMLACGKWRQFERGQPLFTQGEPSTGLHCVVTGIMRVTGCSIEGNETLMALVRPGEWTGFLAVLDRGSHAYAVNAGEASEIFSVACADTSAIFRRDVATFELLVRPELMLARNVARYLVELHTASPERRVASRLCDLARWAHSPASVTTARTEKISQADLAGSLNMSRQYVNRILAKFAKLGLIETGYSSVQLIEAEKLRAFADGRTEIE